VSDRGSSAVEFALVLPLVLLVLLAAVEVVVVARTQLDVGHAAREGARQAATAPDIERAVSAARRSLPESLAGSARVTVERQQHVGGTARVTVSIRHRVAAPLLGGIEIVVRSTAVMRVER
jgi:Flp pilus assembly protein TadG